MPQPIRLSPPESWAVTLAEAKAHIRVDHTDDDAYINSLIGAGHAFIERAVGVTLTWTRYRVQYDQFPDVFELPRRPLVLGSTGTFPAQVQGVTAGTNDHLSPTVNYVDGFDTETTFNMVPADEDWRAIDGNPPQIALWKGVTWPLINTYNPWPVWVDFTAGYSRDGKNVPVDLKQALLLLVGHWYLVREAASPDSGMPAPYAVEALLANYESGEYS